MRIVEKYNNIGNELCFLHNTFYHVQWHKHDNLRSLFEGQSNEITNTFTDFFCDYNNLFFCNTNSHKSYKFNGKEAQLISDTTSIFSKIGKVYVGSNVDHSRTFYDESFRKLTKINLDSKLLLYADTNFYIYLYWNIDFGLKSNMQDHRHLRIIECTDLQHNVLWTYTADHLGFYETIEKVKREFDVNRETGESIEKLTILETKQNPVLFANGEKPLVIGDNMLFGTNNLWIVAIDITTGQELYVIKNIEEAHFQNPLEPPSKSLVKHQPWIGALMYHKKNDVMYSFMNNTYLEIDYRTGKLLMIDNRTAEFMLLHKTSQSRLSEHAYWRVDDIIYYISDMDMDGDKKKVTVYLTAYNVKTRAIIFEYPLGKNWKEKCAFHAFKKFQLVDNRFYILDYNNTLWVFEDDEFYNRHPDNKA